MTGETPSGPENNSNPSGFEAILNRVMGQREPQTRRNQLKTLAAFTRMELAHRASDRANRHAEAHLKRHYPDMAEAEEMRASIDSPVIHYHQPPPQSGGGLAKAILGAGLLATGIGTGVGGLMLADALRSKEPPPVVQQEPPVVRPDPHGDHDTQFELRLSPPTE